MKTLLLDIETRPGVAFFWQTRKVFISKDMIVDPGRTLCFAAQFLGEKKMHFYSEWEHGFEAMISAMHDLLDEADAVVHYNGTKFDMPTLNREFVRLSLPQPSKYAEVDLYRTVRAKFKLDSYTLDFVCRELGLGSKLTHKGMALWIGVMDGNVKDQRDMEKYNKQDVRLLKPLYSRLKPWLHDHPNPSVDTDPQKPTCPTCGSTHMHSRGSHTTKTQKYRRYQCQTCHSWSRSRYTELKKNENILARIP